MVYTGDGRLTLLQRFKVLLTGKLPEKKVQQVKVVPYECDNRSETPYKVEDRASTVTNITPVNNDSDDHASNFSVDSPRKLEKCAYEVFRSMKKSTIQDFDYQEGLDMIHTLSTSTQFVKSFFPKAQPSYDILNVVKKELALKNILPNRTLYAQSVCPDEINHCNGGIANVFEEHFGASFKLGGLGGIPFSGNTGFAAFSHHVPDDGNLFILFAPHIGCSEHNTLGHYTRRGQHRDGKACGAAIGALNHCLDCDSKVKTPRPFDLQMGYIISEVSKRIDVIKTKTNENERQALLVKQMFEISRAFLDEIVTLDFGTVHSNLVLLGGIQINMPGLLNDYFQPLVFEIRHRNRDAVGNDYTAVKIDLLSSFE